MTKLAYVVCVGAEDGKSANKYHTDMCNLCLDSIHTFTDYGGELLVLTDSPEQINNNCNIIEISKDEITSTQDAVVLRHKLRNYINADEFESILYLDNDILALGDITEIHDYTLNCDETITFAEEFPYNTFKTDTHLISRQQRREYENRPRVNAGTFCIDTRNTSRYIQLEAMMEEFITDYSNNNVYHGINQMPIQICIMNNRLAYESIPHQWIDFPIPALGQEKGIVNLDRLKLIHFSSGSMSLQSQFEYMKTAHDVLRNGNRELLEEQLRNVERNENTKWLQRQNNTQKNTQLIHVNNCCAKIYVETEEEENRINHLSTETDFLRYMLDDIAGESVFYDIGANIGTHTLLVACGYPNVRVVSFEPVMENYTKLRKNIELSQADNVTAIDKAVFDESNTVQINTTGEHAGEGKHYISENGETTIQTVTAKELIDSAVPNPDSIKIDVEGAEYNVLLGLADLLESLPTLYVEVHPDRMEKRYNYNDEELKEYLTEMGYSIDVLTRRRTEYFITAV